MIDATLLGMMISQCCYEMFGFGPSQSICGPFAEQVIAEAEAFRVNLEVPT